MARRTLTMRSAIAYPQRYPKDMLSLDNVNGVDLLDTFENWANNLKDDSFKDTAKRWYGMKPEVERRNRLVILTMRTGHYGSEDDWVIDSVTHLPKYKTSENDSATIRTRVAFLVPPGYNTGLFFLEKQGAESCGPAVIKKFDVLASEMSAGLNRNGQAANLTLRLEQVVEPEAWLQAADLEEIRVIRKSYTSDIADDNPLGGVELRYESVLLPKRGSRLLPKKAWQLIQEKKLRSAAYLGLPDTDSIDSFIVGLRQGERQKQVVIGKEKGPRVSTLLNDWGEPRLDTTKFIDVVDAEAESYYGRYQLPWDARWTRN